MRWHKLYLTPVGKFKPAVNRSIVSEPGRFGQGCRKALNFKNTNNLAIDFPGRKHNRNKKIRAQLRILMCIAIVYCLRCIAYFTMAIHLIILSWALIFLLQ